MPCVCYVPKKFHASSLAIIADASQIIASYLRQGFKLTLRQLYYQFVARDLLPDSWIDPAYNIRQGLPPGTKNTLKNYKRLGDLINDGRLAGKIDWNAIEDRTRNLQSGAHWSSPNSIVRACANQYAVDMWDDQNEYVEVWVEKDALIGVLEGICTELDVPYFACRGYTSQSEMWGAAQRLIDKESEGKETTIIHLGDHDPSGIDMSRDIQDRLDLFGSSVTVERIGLTFDQVHEYDPPPNPAKTTDARYRSYADLYGDDSWELDALEPRVIVDLIRQSVESKIDHEFWEDAEARQETGRKQLNQVSEGWDNVIEYISQAG